MLAVVVHAPGILRVEEVSDPVPAADEVLLRMAFGGICGSDLSYWKNGTSGTAVLRQPLILGHEVSGTIEAVGKQALPKITAEGLNVGDLVTVHPATLVGNHRIPADTAKRTNLWPEVRYFGSAAFEPHERGGFSTLRAVRPDQLRAVPGGVDAKQAALAEPFGVALHALARAGDVTGRSVLINGAGPIGALAVAAAQNAGAARVVAADLFPAALDIARAMGADETVNVGDGQSLPRDIDVAIEASGASLALGGVVAAVRRGGVIVQVGNMPGGDVKASLGGIVTREIDYRGSYRFVDEISDALQAMADGLDVSPLITHTLPLSRAVEGFEIAANRSTGSSKVLLDLTDWSTEG